MHANTSTTATMPTFTALRRNNLNTYTARSMRPFVLLEYPWAVRRSFEALALRDELHAVAANQPDLDAEPTRLWH